MKKTIRYISAFFVLSLILVAGYRLFVDSYGFNRLLSSTDRAGATESTGSVTSFRSELTLMMNSESGSSRVDATGDVIPPSKLSLEYSITSNNDTFSYNQIVIGDTQYLKGPFTENQWTQVDYIWEQEDIADINLSIDPLDYQKLTGVAESTPTVSSITLNEQPVQYYTFRVSKNAFMATLPNAPDIFTQDFQGEHMDVGLWIGIPDGLPHQVQLISATTTPTASNTNMVIAFSDFNEQFVIQAPNQPAPTTTTTLGNATTTTLPSSPATTLSPNGDGEDDSSGGLPGLPTEGASGGYTGVSTSFKPVFLSQSPIPDEEQDLDNALADAVAAIRSDPNSAVAYNDLAVVFAKKGRIVAAINAFEKSRELDPKFVWSLYNLGALYQRLGENGLAAIWYRRALEVDPAFDLALTAYSVVKADMSQSFATISSPELLYEALGDMSSIEDVQWLTVASNNRRPSVVVIYTNENQPSREVATSVYGLSLKYDEDIDFYTFNLTDEALTLRLLKRYQFSVLPTIILVDQTGNMVRKHGGYVDGQTLEQWINQLLPD